jgi:hypothetical protein
MSRVETSGFYISPSDRFPLSLRKTRPHPCVPMHRQIKPKTLQSILKQANITIEELLENI